MYISHVRWYQAVLHMHDWHSSICLTLAMCQYTLWITCQAGLMGLNGKHLPTQWQLDWSQCYGCRLLTTLHRVWILCPVISTTLSRLRSTWVASSLQRMSVWSKLSPHGYRHFTPMSAMRWYKARCLGGKNSWMLMVTLWWSDVYHLLCVCHIFIEVRKNSWHLSVFYLIL